MTAAHLSTAGAIRDAAEEEGIRRDEWRRIAALLEEHADTIGSFAVDAPHALRLTAFMLELRLPPRDGT